MPKLMMEVPPPPEGFEYTYEYRRVKAGEYYASSSTTQYCTSTTLYPHPILRKKAWRAKCGDEVWFINNTCEVDSAIDTQGAYSNRFHAIGNYFKTKEEAKEALNTHIAPAWEAVRKAKGN